MRRGLIALGLLVGLVGCGQTDYATEVSEDSAQLNGTITTLTDGVETSAWFEYWPAATPANVTETAPQSVTATGPIGADVSGLANHTEYRYRLCGTEDDSEVVCAQERRFTTGRSTVQAYGESERLGDDPRPSFQQWLDQLDFDALAGPTGVSGPAFLHYKIGAGSAGVLDFPLGSPSAPMITCFAVNDNVAVIGLRNPERTAPQSFVQLVDAGPLGSGDDAARVLVNGLPPENANRDPSDCSPIQSRWLFDLIAGEIAVNEAPPAPG
jgi:hypothetical protein